MNLLDGYVDKDVVIHFTRMINDAGVQSYPVEICGNELWHIIKKYELDKLVEGSVLFMRETESIAQETETGFIDRVVHYAKNQKTIVTIKESHLSIPGHKTTLKELQEQGAEIRMVKDILGAMVVASKKRRNKVVFPISGFEDEALITAAGLAKSKTVGFRNFYILNHHISLAGIINSLAENKTETEGFIVPLKVGINTGITSFSEIPLLYNKGVVFSGYQPSEIMQSVWMTLSQHIEKKQAVVFQRTKEVSDEAINRSRWMLEEVFEPGPLLSKKYGTIPNGRLIIKDKYKAFDLEG